MKKFESLKYSHQVELKSLKQQSKDYTLEFFKVKAADLHAKLTTESNWTYDNYDQLRTKYLK